ncbi:MAG: hypothetical protein HC808_06090 [Candidatus Competibacteraceae bacterium]|nr:hypothetical protein [Candidatus Competibacteraceae bacterium]
MRTRLLSFNRYLMALGLVLASAFSHADEWSAQRAQMIDEIEADVRATASHVNRRTAAWKRVIR